MISGKTLFAAVAMLGVSSPAYAVTINTYSSTTNNPNAPAPSGTNATVFQNFDTNAPNGTPFVRNMTPLGAFGSPPFVVTETTTGDVRTYQNDQSGEAVGPVVTPSTESFLSILNGSYTAAFTPGVRVLSFVFGGLDAYNSVTLNLQSAGAVTLTGLQILSGNSQGAIGSGNFNTTGRVTYDFGTSDILNSVTFASSQAAFEIDALAAAAPEPATWAMMLLGFGMIGSALRRRRVTAKVRYNFA